MYEETANYEEYVGDSEELFKYRKWFRAAVESWQRWRDEAKEDYEFLAGKQWSDKELKIFEKEKRAVLVINRIKPLINILSGWQRMNRFDISFLPRTEDDLKHCEVRAGVTKYILDRCDYENKESTVFLDTATGGIGWFGVKYKFDAEIGKGDAVIERVSPFDMYVDPEAHELDFSDAKFICRAKWADKGDLKKIYPDKSEEIENNFNIYDAIEKENQEKIMQLMMTGAVADYQELLQQQAQAQQQELQAKIQIEEIKNRDFRQTLAYKDLPLPLQMAMAAKAGYVDQRVANYFMQAMIEQLAPQLAIQMKQQAQMQAVQQQQMLMQQQMQAQQQPPQMQLTPEIASQLKKIVTEEAMKMSKLTPEQVKEIEEYGEDGDEQAEYWKSVKQVALNNTLSKIRRVQENQMAQAQKFKERHDTAFKVFNEFAEKEMQAADYEEVRDFAISDEFFGSFPPVYQQAIADSYVRNLRKTASPQDNLLLQMFYR